MIFAANFKTNHTRASTEKYIKALKKKLLAKKLEDQVYIFPPATALDKYEGDFTIGIYAVSPAADWFFREMGSLELEVLGHSL